MDDRPVFYKPLMFYDLAVHGEYAWFCNATYCALFRIDLKSFEIKLETFLPSDSKDEFCQYGPIAYFDNKLIIAPYKAKSILIYDLFTKHIDKIKLDMDDFFQDDIRFLFTRIEIYKGAAFLLPGTYHAIVRIDLNTYEVAYMKDWYDKISYMLTKPEEIIFWGKFLRDDGVCVLSCWQNDNIMEIDLNTGEYEVFSLKCGNKALSDVYYEDGIYWFAYRYEPLIIRYDKRQGSWSSVQMPADLYSEMGLIYLISYENYIYGIPFYGNMMVKIDKLTGNSSCFMNFHVMDFNSEMKNQGLPKSNAICFRMVNSHEAVLFSLLDGKILKLDFEREELVECNPTISEEDESFLEEHMKTLYCMNANILFEQEDVTLQDLISSICNSKTV